MNHEAFHILLVEDEEAHAELTCRAIRKTGNTSPIDIVTDGEQALDYVFNRGKYADKNRFPYPDLILLDLKLPGIDGIEILRQIKEHPFLRRIPVIVLTTSQREEDIASSYGYHANSYLTKPVGLKEFEKKVMQMDLYWTNLNESPVSIGPF